jgi:hypothetical protein
MSRSRGIYGLLCLSCGIIVCLLGFPLYDQVSRSLSIAFNEEDLDRIEEGMSHSEVERVLGLPPGNYCTDDQIERSFLLVMAIDRHLRYCPHSEWLSDEGMIQIIYKDGKVWHKRFYPAIHPRRSWFERVRSRLGL